MWGQTLGGTEKPESFGVEGSCGRARKEAEAQRLRVGPLGKMAKRMSGLGRQRPECQSHVEAFAAFRYGLEETHPVKAETQRPWC